MEARRPHCPLLCLLHAFSRPCSSVMRPTPGPVNPWSLCYKLKGLPFFCLPKYYPPDIPLDHQVVHKQDVPSASAAARWTADYKSNRHRRTLSLLRSPPACSIRCPRATPASSHPAPDSKNDRLGRQTHRHRLCLTPFHSICRWSQPLIPAKPLPPSSVHEWPWWSAPLPPASWHHRALGGKLVSGQLLDIIMLWRGS